MRRIRLNRWMPIALFAIATALTASGADGPGAVLKGWGRVFDPDKDCKVDADGDRLTIGVPGSPHDLSAELERMNAPRVVRDVSGDFIAQVKVEGNVRPDGESQIEGRTAFNGAGILLWKDARNYVRLERAAIENGGQRRHYVNFELRKDGQMIAIPALDLVRDIPDAPTYLRLERRGGKLIPSTGGDGLQWQAWPSIADEFPAGLKLGVAAINSASAPFTAEFREFQVYERAVEGSPRPEAAPQPATTPAPKDGAEARHVLEGAWRIVGGKAEDGDYRKVPYAQVKIVTQDRCAWASYEPGTGAVIRAAGGSCRLGDGTYVERLEYANADDLAGLIGKDQKFTWKVEGDRWYLSGNLSNGQRIEELWERAK